MKHVLSAIILLALSLPAFGQTVTMPKDQSAKIGETVTLVVSNETLFVLIVNFS